MYPVAALDAQAQRSAGPAALEGEWAGEIDKALTWAEQAVILGQTNDAILAIGLGERVWGEALPRSLPTLG